MAVDHSYIPFLYRFLFLYYEPFSAFGGSILCWFNPSQFLLVMAPTSMAVYAPSNQVIYDQLAATYMLFAFNEAVVLRLTDDLNVWKGIVAGILLCDLGHLWAAYRIWGIVCFQPWLWRPEEWVNLGMIVVPGIIRVALLLDVGIGKKKVGKKGKEKGS